MVDQKRQIKADSIIVKIEIVSPKALKFSFFKNDENIGVRLLKGKFKDDECFYTRRLFYVVLILPPVLWWYEDGQKRIYRIDDELIIETTYSTGGCFLIMAGGHELNDIWKFEVQSDKAAEKTIDPKSEYSPTMERKK